MIKNKKPAYWRAIWDGFASKGAWMLGYFMKMA
jgi:hypothetical protein